MQEKKYEITYNSDHYTVAANDIIKGKQAMNLQTARLIRLLITQVCKEDTDLKIYTCRISELAEFLNIDRHNLYRDIKDICESAMKSVVYIGTNDAKQPWKMFHWVSSAEYDGNGTLSVKLSDEIKPYILALDKWFTQYQLKNILQFNSYYAIRLYELLKCEDGIARKNNLTIEFTVAYLREYFQCEKKYDRIIDFKRYVIEVAVREINEKSDIMLYVDYLKRSRMITKVSFEIHENHKTRSLRKALNDN
jgi:plasmid replication initiation protein